MFAHIELIQAFASGVILAAIAGVFIILWQRKNLKVIDSERRRLEAVAIKGDKIIHAGNYLNIKNFVGEKTKTIDLDGNTMIPGLIEGHGHIMGVGYNQLNLDLLNTNSFEEIIEIVKQKSNKTI